MSAREGYRRDVLEVVRAHRLPVNMDTVMQHYYPRERPMVERALGDLVESGDLALAGGMYRRAA